jgi:sugar-specific transcriptional regulator TrmB
LSQEWMLKVLRTFGFKEVDAAVYLYLALNGPQTAKNIDVSLNMYKRQVYRSVKNLEARKILTSTAKNPAKFQVITLDKLLDMLAESRTQKANEIEQSKNELIAVWKSRVEHK